MPNVELSFASGESSLSVRSFRIEEAISRTFSASIMARSPAQIDLETIVGREASLSVQTGLAFAHRDTRLFSGVCNHIEQVRAEPTGLSTYELRIVPKLWLLTQRRGYRVHQHLTIPDIVDRILGEWRVEPVWAVDRGRYPKLQYRVQYGESDYAFVCRLLEEEGIAFTFAEDQGRAGRPVLGDALQTATPRSPVLPFLDSPSEAAEKEFVTELKLSHEVRPGAYTIRDYDFRRPAFDLVGTATREGAPEDGCEQYHYDPGAFVVEGAQGGGTPVADDKGVARADQAEGSRRADRLLDAARAGRRAVSFRTNALDVAPGLVINVEGHPHAELSAASGLLVTESVFDGSIGGDWTLRARAVFTDVPYRPPLLTAKPVVEGVQSAVVVGPAGQEIHTDELGRVRAQFPWDREGKNNDDSSCWIRVAQGWAGTGFGMITIPRVGQEVLVGFLEGNPDEPVVVGRVFNGANPVPYTLPEHRTRSTWKSQSSPGGNGFNEIMLEDAAGDELVWVQAQKDLRKLVKHDETVTIGHDRQKLVKGDENEKTGGDRTELTGGERIEITRGDRITVIGRERRELVKADAVERIEGDALHYVGGDQHLIVRGRKRELIERDSHLTVKGDRNEKVGKTRSLSAGSHQIGVGGSHAVSASKEIHHKSLVSVVIEAPEITLKAPGGFVRIDSSGVFIVGGHVNINSGGAAGVAQSGGGKQPERPEEAQVAVPLVPEPEDVSKTGLGR